MDVITLLPKQVSSYAKNSSELLVFDDLVQGLLGGLFMVTADSKNKNLPLDFILKHYQFPIGYTDGCRVVNFLSEYNEELANQIMFYNPRNKSEYIQIVKPRQKK